MRSSSAATHCGMRARKSALGWQRAPSHPYTAQLKGIHSLLHRQALAVRSFEQCLDKSRLSGAGKYGTGPKQSLQATFFRFHQRYYSLCFTLDSNAPLPLNSGLLGRGRGHSRAHWCRIEVRHSACPSTVLRGVSVELWIWHSIWKIFGCVLLQV